MRTALEAGYIKLYRGLIDSRVFANADLLKIWLWCLLKANHKVSWVSLTTGKGKTELEVQRGAFVFGSHMAAKELDFSPSKCYSLLRKLERLGRLTRQVNTHFTLVKINNYNYYQLGAKVTATNKPTEPVLTEKNNLNPLVEHPLLSAKNKAWLAAIKKDYSQIKTIDAHLNNFCATNKNTQANLYQWRALFSEYLETNLKQSNSN